MQRCLKEAHSQECPAVGPSGPSHGEQPCTPSLPRPRELGPQKVGTDKSHKTCSHNQRSVQSLPTQTEPDYVEESYPPEDLLCPVSCEPGPWAHKPQPESPQGMNLGGEKATTQT